MSQDLIRAILALKERVEKIEAENKALREQFNAYSATFEEFIAAMTEYVDRQDAKHAAPPAIVDEDGVVATAAEELIQKVEAYKSEMTQSMDSLKRMFQQRLSNDEIKGSRSAML